MTLRQYLITMLIGTVFCWTAWFFVILNIDPFESPIAGFVLFYLSLFLALVGTISVSSFLLHRFFSKELVPMFKYVQKSFREALLISAIMVFLLFLKGIKVLNLWNLSIFILVLVLVFAFFWTTKKPNSQTDYFSHNV